MKTQPLGGPKLESNHVSRDCYMEKVQSAMFDYPHMTCNDKILVLARERVYPLRVESPYTFGDIPSTAFLIKFTLDRAIVIAMTRVYDRKKMGNLGLPKFLIPDPYP